jgi:hypothetical protein
MRQAAPLRELSKVTVSGKFEADVEWGTKDIAEQKGCNL